MEKTQQFQSLCSPVEKTPFPLLIDHLKQHSQINSDLLIPLIKKAHHYFSKQPNILRVSSPVRVVGDIHGQFYDLVYILNTYGDLQQDKNCQFLFLGDYVDRGFFCLEVMVLLMVLKCKYPKRIHMLRGNHEGRTMAETHNFRAECFKKHNVDIYEMFIDLFCQLPLCAMIDEKYFAVHGGISPDLKKISDLNRVNRFKEIQQTGVICDLLWSDPSNSNNLKWEKNKTRSCSYYYGRKHTKKFIDQNKIQMIVRGHEVQMNGFGYQTSEYKEKLTLTLFSAPNYCDTYRNKGGIAIFEKGCIRIENFSQVEHPFVFPNYVNLFEWSLPMIANKTTKMFLHLFKSLDKKQSQNEEQIKTSKAIVDKIEALDQLLENKNCQNFEMILNNSQSADSPSKDLSPLPPSQSIFQFFTHLKSSDANEKYPEKVIGPNIQLRKFNLVQDQQEEDCNFDFGSLDFLGKNSEPTKG